MTHAAPGDTIVAVATPPGRGGIGVVRVSGGRVAAIAAAMLGRLPEPRYAGFFVFRDGAGEGIDRGLALYFPAPHSYTGEDVLELHAHGSPVVLDALVAVAVAAGARAAGPGEFTERAYLNGKMDLAQAEAVADLIESASLAQARAAARTLAGAFSEHVQVLHERLIRLRVHTEAAIDFASEDIDFLADAGLIQGYAEAQASLAHLWAASSRGAVLREGLTVVIAGAPNAGKSSLMNALSGEDTAIVSAHPGTTRDLLRVTVTVSGVPVTLVDSAGLRVTGDEIEQEGVRRAVGAMRRADLVLRVRDDTQREDGAVLAAADWPEGVPVLTVWNKIDLTGRVAGRDDADGSVAISARHGTGLDDLRRALRESAGFSEGEGGLFSARRRHLDALERVRRGLAAAAGLAREGQGELAAEELRLSLEALGEITGEFGSEELLGEIFGAFCIGK